MGLSLEKLCSGCCSAAYLCKIESGEKEPEKFLLDRLWGRLGKSMECLECVLGEEEYEIYEIRGRIENALEDGEWAAAEKWIDFYEEKIDIKKNLHRQYIARSKGILYYQTGKREMAKRMIEEAIGCTILTFPEKRMWDFAMSVEEMELLLLHQELGQNMGMLEKISWLSCMIDKIQKNNMEEKEQSRIFPKIVIELSKLGLEEKELKGYTKKALELLIETGNLLHFMKIVKMYLEMLEKEKCGEEYKIFLNGYSSMKILCQKYRKTHDDPIWKNRCEWELYLDYELLQKSRMVRGISQEELCDEICNRETISRIENRKNKISDSKFYSLAEKLQKRKNRYTMFINTDQYELSKKERQIGKLLWYNQCEEAEKIFCEIERNGLPDTRENKQYLLFERTCLDWRKGKITRKEGIVKLKESLSYTLSKEEIENIEDIFLTRQEINILNNLAVGYYKIGRREEAVSILYKVLANYNNTKVMDFYHAKGIFPILANLATYLEEMGNYEGAIEMCDRAIRLGFSIEKNDIFQRFLTTKACVLEDKGKKESAIEYFTQSYHISCLMKDQHTASIIKSHLQNRYQINL